jgi:hypothetical protein
MRALDPTRTTLAVGGLLLCLLSTAPVHGDDPAVAYLASQVTQENVTSIIQTLEDFGTRYSYTEECDQAAEWIHDRMLGYGLSVSYQPFPAGSYTFRNVVAELPGTVDPDRVVIIGAHYDSTSQTPMSYAPGADDNASGVAAVLEAARIFSGFQFEVTVEFIAFGGEEQGRLGSRYNAAMAAHLGKDILGMINLDMIGYWPPSSDMELDIGKNDASADIAAVTEAAALAHADIPLHNWPDTGVCHDDHVSYWAEGYKGIVLMDCYEAHANPGGSGESTPYYHTTSDTIDTLDLAQTTEAVRAAVAGTAALAAPVVLPLELYVAKLPATGDVLLTWNGGVPPFVAEACAEGNCAGGAFELTPPGGTIASQWLHPGVLNDGQDYYYRVEGP